MEDRWLSHRALEVLVNRGEELLRGLVLLCAAHQQRQVLRHLAAFDRLDADPLERLGELRDRGRAVHPPAGAEPAGPGEDRGDRVGGSRVALLVLAVVAGGGGGGGGRPPPPCGRGPPPPPPPRPPPPPPGGGGGGGGGAPRFFWAPHTTPPP